jgi:DNA-binding NarL/FixJ family response regulator
MSRSRILLVDDHPMIREGIEDLISDQADLEWCGAAADAPEAFQAVQDKQPDLVVVDLTLPRGSGLELIKQLRAASGDIRILVFSMHDEKLYAERCLAAGAMGYVSKQESPERLLEAIRKILQGKVALSGDMTEHMLQTMTRAGAEQDVGKDLVGRLSDRELQVFELLGGGRSTRQTAEHLNLSIKTVQTHIENIKGKLNLGSLNELITRAAQWTADEG